MESPGHPASLMPLRVQTGSRRVCASTAPAAIVQGARGQVPSCSSAARVRPPLPAVMVLSSSALPCTVTWFLLPAGPSPIIPSHLGLPPSHLPRSLCFHRSQSELPFEGWSVGIVHVLFLNGICHAVSLFQAPRGVSVPRVPVRQPGHWG